MRRKQNEITNKSEIETLLKKAPVCRIGLSDEGSPYIVPMNFGYENGRIYLHSAPEGRKLDIIQKNNLVCFEVDEDHEIVTSEQACGWGMNYKSVIGTGYARLVTAQEERIQGLNSIMEKYSGKREFDYDPATMNRTSVICIEILEMTGKKSGN